MSWASNNPEKWQEICVSAVASKLRKTVKAWFGEDYIPDADSVAEAIAEDPALGKAWLELMAWAGDEIAQDEADYFGGLVDDAKETMRDRLLSGRGFTPLVEKLEEVP
jgi:hypothetical protein